MVTRPRAISSQAPPCNLAVPYNRGYAVVGVYWAHSPDSCRILSVDGKIVIFDTPEMASDFLERLSGGRNTFYNSDREIAVYSPINPNGYNRASVLTGYDPYDVPYNVKNAVGVNSEAKNLDWRWHIHWSNVVKALRKFADKNGVISNDTN